MYKRILLLDGDAEGLSALSIMAAASGHQALTAATGAEAIACLATESPDVCIADLASPAADTFAVLAAARASRPAVPVVVLTGAGELRGAVAALRAGAVDFLPKPVQAPALDELLGRLGAERTEPTRAPRSQRSALVGEHPAMRLVIERIEQIADTDAGVLIRGETGTGKEVIARLIHATSERRGGPFVSVHMAAIPEALAESELFGHAPGAFTGAATARQGRFMAAHGGTLFLDGVCDMPMSLQGKLLRVLQEREVTPLAGTPTPTDVRVIAATHRNLEHMVREGQFREDLFYRLDVIPIEVPALRERREDIPLLADHFRRELNARDGGSVPPFSEEVARALTSYEWPGNVRQLENTIERLVIIARNRAVGVDDLPTNLRSDVVSLKAGLLDLPPSGVDLRMLLHQLEDRLIGQALARTGGNKNRAAELLGLNRTTLVEKLRRRNVA